MLGMSFQHIKRFPPNAAEALNAYVIYVALPALVLNEIAKLTLDIRAIQPVVIAWGVMVCSAVLTYFFSRILRWSRNLTGAMMLVIPLGNTGFVGIPLIEAHLGSSAIPYAILYDQFGTFLALNTFGIAIASIYSSESGTSRSSLWKNIVSFPPFVALLLSFAMMPLGYPAWLQDILPRLASTLVPVVMVAVGLQWRLRLERNHIAPLLLALVITLVIQPLFAWSLVELFELKGLVAHVIILEAAMPSMISAGVLAISYNLAPKLARSIVGYSLMLSLGSVWLWRVIL